MRSYGNERPDLNRLRAEKHHFLVIPNLSWEYGKWKFSRLGDDTSMIPVRFTCLSGLLLCLAACATPNQQAASADQSTYLSDMEQYNDCLRQAADHPEYIYLAQHFNLGDPTKDTVAQRADQSMASSIDVQMLQNYRAAIDTCQKQADANQTGYTAFAVAFNQAEMLNDDNLATLIDRQATWGEFVTTRDYIAGQLPVSLDRWRGDVEQGQPYDMSAWHNAVSQVQEVISQREGRMATW